MKLCWWFGGRLKVFVPMMVLGMVILIPVNVGAGSLSDQGTTSHMTGNATSTKFLFSSIDKLSMSNVPNGSPRCFFITSPHSI